MRVEETEKFQNELNAHINILENLPQYQTDIALKRIVKLLNEITSKSDLKKQKNLINRITLDSVENWKIINVILEFINTHT
jgi:hypothetical protein